MGFHESSFWITPEGLNAVNMPLAIGKLVIAMVETIMLFVSQSNESTVTAPSIGVNNALRLHLAADNGLRGLSGAVGKDL